MLDNLPFSQQIIIQIVVGLFIVAGSFLTARASLRRVPAQNEESNATAVKAYADAAAQREAENKLLREELRAFEKRFEELEQRIYGPFRITLDVRTQPSLSIIAQSIAILPNSEEVAQDGPSA